MQSLYPPPLSFPPLLSAITFSRPHQMVHPPSLVPYPTLCSLHQAPLCYPNLCPILILSHYLTLTSMYMYQPLIERPNSKVTSQNSLKNLSPELVKKSSVFCTYMYMYILGIRSNILSPWSFQGVPVPAHLGSVMSGITTWEE